MERQKRRVNLRNQSKRFIRDSQFNFAELNILMESKQNLNNFFLHWEIIYPQAQEKCNSGFPNGAYFLT